MVLFTQEGQTIVASLTGYGEWVPPASADDFLACVRDLVQDDVYALVRDAEPIDDIATYRFPAGHRRRYERLRRHPPGLISTGDSICCLNPVYGAGVTIAAELAVLLGDCLRRTDDQAGLPRRFYAGADRITRAPWLMSTLSDRVINPPSRPSPATALTAFYMRRVAATAARDPEVATALFESVGMIASPLTLARPRFLARVLLPTRRSPAARPPGLRQAINPAQENRRAPA
jgi:2-polyprenyl-6-methoxyphenol hydroxylase-like FAD-dependent oxidoreductase